MTSIRRQVTAAAAVVTTVLALFVGALAFAPGAFASHYRANQINWHLGSSPREAEFHVTGSWRCTFFFDDGSGQCNASVGATFFGSGLDFGDGITDTPEMTVTSVDVTNDVITGEAHVTHLYATDGPFTAAATDCCRLSGPQHINNPDGSIRYETVVDFAQTTASPVGLVAPIVDCPIDAVCQFTVPAADPDGQALRWRLSTFDEGLLTQPAGASIDPATGLYRWDTTGAVLNTTGFGDTFYSTQVMIENVVGGTVVSQTAVDFFIRLSNSTSNHPPVFVTPTPADGAVFTGTVGTPLTMDLAATDPDTADTVMIGVLGSVPGLTFSGTPGNPASGTFSGAPTTPGDYPLTATAADQSGLGATARGYTVHITATSNRPPTADAGGPYSGVEGSAIPITGTGSDPDGDTLTYAWSVAPASGTDPGAACTIAAPTAATTSVTCTDDGTYTLTLTADDGHGHTATSTATATIDNAAPDATLDVPATAAVGASVPMSGTVTDPGSNDTYTYTLDFGDGTPAASGSVAGGAVNASHAYAAPGTYTVTLTVTDDDGGQKVVTKEITVTAPETTTVRVQVDTYTWGMSGKLPSLTYGRRIAAFDDDAKLPYAEDFWVSKKLPYGNYVTKKSHIFTLTMPVGYTPAQLIASVNAVAVPAGFPAITTRAKLANTVGKRGQVTDAWVLASAATVSAPWGPSKDLPQTYLGRG